MTSTISWLDHDSAAHERSLRFLALFREKDSRDELGIGSIRDAISDHLFPGTSIIQTRLRYMLFIPWLYAGLEERRIPSHSLPGQGRAVEAQLRNELMEHDKGSGIIGRDAGAVVQRLPSSVYWTGLGAWGLRRFQGSQQDYLRSMDQILALRGNRARRDDGEWVEDVRSETWSPHAVALRPEGFPTGATFLLEKEEAEFIRESLQRHQRGSLLTWLASKAGQSSEPILCDFPWMHPDKGSFSPTHSDVLDWARLFSFLVRGAALLYNLQLAELAESDGLVEEHRRELEEWQADHEFVELAVWSPAFLWPLSAEWGRPIQERTKVFVEKFWKTVLEAGSPISDLPSARSLVREREIKLKNTQSRFVNLKALGQWSGHAGTRRLSYRWGTVGTLLEDLRGGL
jgi:hypothetical protein